MNELVIVQHRTVKTTSVIVAVFFEKRHDRVLEAIRYIIPDLPKSSVPFFREASYFDEQGKPRPMYEMTRDGFSLLAMGFNGKKALGFKLRFLEAFNQMERTLLQKQNLSWQDQRTGNKIGRRAETDTLSRFVEYATAQGSQSARLYYMNVTKMTNQALNLVKQTAPQPLRDTMDSMQLSFLTTAEYLIREVIESGMAAGLPYKEIYLIARDSVSSYAATLPVQRKIPA